MVMTTVCVSRKGFVRGNFPGRFNLSRKLLLTISVRRRCRGPRFGTIQSESKTAQTRFSPVCGRFWVRIGGGGLGLGLGFGLGLRPRFGLMVGGDS